MSEQTFYRWTKHFMGLGLQELRELRSLRHENSKLKQVIADLTLDRHISRRSFEKSRKSLAHVALAITQDALRQRLRELAAVRVRFGYRRLTVLLRREGWRVNAKRIYRLYGDEGLTVRTKPRKRLASRRRVPMPVAMRPKKCRRVSKRPLSSMGPISPLRYCFVAVSLRLRIRPAMLEYAANSRESSFALDTESPWFSNCFAALPSVRYRLSNPASVSSTILVSTGFGGRASTSS